MPYDCQSMTAPIRRLLIKRPEAAFFNQNRIDAQWQELHFIGPPNYAKALEEYQTFEAILANHVDELHFLPFDDSTTLDSIYTHDPVIITRKGAILCNMGKPARASEPERIGAFLEKVDVPVLGKINGRGRLEGGDVVWLTERILAVGLGYRTNEEGIRQLRNILGDLVDEIIAVPLPHWNGADDVLHLMSILSPIDEDLHLVYSRLLPAFFRQKLLDRGVRLIEVPDEEYESMTCNVLALAPGKCLMLVGNPITRKRLEAAGTEVFEFKGEEICHKGAGGPTCLTRPLLRK